MFIDRGNAPAVIRHAGKVVACAKGGRLVLEKPRLLRFLNLTLTKEGYPLLVDLDEDRWKWLLEQGCRLVDPSWYYALSKELEIGIRNSDGSSTCFGSCRAELQGLSQMPATKPLPSVDFYVLDLLTDRAPARS
jgi:hypothetical protein